MDRARRLRWLEEGDVEAARALVPDALRAGDDVLLRRLARRLIDAGDAAVLQLDRSDVTVGRDDPLTILRRVVASERHHLLAPVPLPLSWDAQIARRFACDCAARALGVFERVHPDDARPRQALDVARAYARGEVDHASLLAAKEAAWFASSWADKWSAEVAARAVACAVENLAPDAAYYALEALDDYDERDWQCRRLLAYLLDEPLDEV